MAARQHGCCTPNFATRVVLRYETHLAQARWLLYSILVRQGVLRVAAPLSDGCAAAWLLYAELCGTGCACWHDQ
ncbi:MAG TPA: hypothetical protein DEF43_18980 [Chloroflexus aurantiacus]|nr:hypothetical protein [Chloroflexus aurantiacus]